MSEVALSKPVIIVSGTTASGKSDLALEIAKQIDGIVINADSKQVYKEIPIGTAQPNWDMKSDDHFLLDEIPHYLYGFRSVLDPYNVSQYQNDVYSILEKTDQVPILTGGTGLYIDSIAKNYHLEVDKVKDRSDLEELTVEQLQKKAGELILSMNESDKQNKQRLIRMIQRGAKPRIGQSREYLYLQTNIEKETLFKKIEKRVDKMFDEGLIGEAKLFKNEILSEDKRLKIIGYQEFKGYFEGGLDLAGVKDLIILHTRQYVKKQLTWFNKVERRILVENSDEAMNHIKNFLSNSTSL